MITSFVKTMCDFSFRGRSTKKEFLSFFAIWLLISIMFLTVIMALAITVLELKINTVSGAISIPHKMRTAGVLPFILMMTTICAYVIFNVWAFISASLLSIRRLHDMNYSGVCYWVWMSALLLFCVSETSILTAILLYFLIGGLFALGYAKSFPSHNKYGKVDVDELLLNLEKQNG